MATNPTVSELRKAAEVSDDEIDAAVDAYSADPATAPFRIADGYVIDVAAAVQRHAPARRALAEAGRPARFKRNRVRTAILLAHPVKG
jgi:hypothetical protein